tara:strand:+ start:391 stop:525 length:135 start_codon:yes stop_codon:yes gene_type:complete
MITFLSCPECGCDVEVWKPEKWPTKRKRKKETANAAANTEVNNG